MGVAVGHGAGAVAEELADHLERHTAHGQIAGGAVTQVMPAEILDARLLQGERKGTPDVIRLFSVMRRENQVRVDPADGSQGPQGLLGRTDKRHAPALHVLGDAERDPTAFEIYAFPSQAQLLPPSHAGRQGEHDGRMQVAAATVTAGLQQGGQLIVGKKAHPSRTHAGLVHFAHGGIRQPAPFPDRHRKEVAQDVQVVPGGLRRDAAAAQRPPAALGITRTFPQEQVTVFGDEGRCDLVEGVFSKPFIPPIQSRQDSRNGARGLALKHVPAVPADGVRQGVLGRFMAGEMPAVHDGRLDGHRPLLRIREPGEGCAFRRAPLLPHLDLESNCPV